MTPILTPNQSRVNLQGLLMSINTKNYKKSKYPHIKVNKKNTTKFLFDIVAKNGKRYRKQYLNTSDLDVYVAFLNWKSSLGLVTTEDATTVEDYFILSQKFSERNDSTKLKYEKYFLLYVSLISKMKIVDVQSRHIDLLNQGTKHLKPSYRKKMFEILVPLFNLAIDDELITVSPIKRRQNVKRKQLQEMKVVTDAVGKYKHLHQAIHKVFKDDPRIRAMFLFGFSGRRKTETLNLKWSDINGDRYTVRGSISKVSTDMTFVMSDDLKEALQQCMNIKTTYIFENSRTSEPIKEIREHVIKIRMASGIENFTFHLMRNIVVSALASVGADTTHLSSLLGHLDTGTLKKYLSLQREASSEITNELSNKLLHG